METTLHRQLKCLYGDRDSDREVMIDGYRIDAVADGRLIEVQCASLSAIRAKVDNLLERHSVHLVKPLTARKLLVTRNRRGGAVVSSRFSPSRETPLHLFDELVHFITVFPHPRLTLELLLVEVEEHRIKRAPRRWRGKNYRVEDRLLRAVLERRIVHDTDDLLAFLPSGLPAAFHTADLAEAAAVPRWLARKMVYCLRKTGAVMCAEKVGRLQRYRRSEPVSNCSTSRRRAA